MKKFTEHDKEFARNIFAVAFCILIGVIIGRFYGKQDSEIFSILNTIFSGLAFAVLSVTFYLQTLTHDLQREELKLTRDELARSAKAQEESLKELERQANNMKQSAKLSALNTLVNHYSEQLRQNYAIGINGNHSREKVSTYINEIERILEEKN